MLNDIEYAKGMAQYENSLSEPPKSETELLQEIEEKELYEDIETDRIIEKMRLKDVQ